MPFAPRRFDFRRRQAEDEDVGIADEVAHLDIGAVERADRQRAVERHLHVAGARGFHARRRDLLGEIDRGNDHFREADVVVRQEHDFQQTANGRVVVDGARHVDRQLDDELGLRVARRRLAREDFYPRREVDRRVGADLVVARNRLEDVEQLALVFMDALDLHVEQGVGVDALVERLRDDLSERDLVGAPRQRESAPASSYRRRSGRGLSVLRRRTALSRRRRP